MGTLKTKAQSILTEKTNKIIPENIKEGVTIFDVTGTFAGSGKLNIYAQTTEPTEKDGIWFETNEEFNSIVEDTSLYASNSWNYDKMNSLKSIPFSFSNGISVKVGDNAYLYQGSTVYKYNIKTDTYEQLTDLEYPMGNNNRAACVKGTDIYLFGLYDSTNSTYTVALRYDTLTGTYFKLQDIPSSINEAAAVCSSDEIFIFYDAYYGYVYNITNNSYSSISAGRPHRMDNSAYALCGNYIYIFGSTYGRAGYEPNKAIKFYIPTRQYTEIANCYTNMNGGAVTVGTDIYLFGGTYSSTSCYKYNTLTNSYTSLASIPYGFSYRGVIFDGINIYLFGGSSSSTKVQVLSCNPKSEYPDKSIIFANNNSNKYQTTLISTNVINGLKYHFDNVFYYVTASGFDTSINKYYGNGTSWTKIN